MSTENIPQEGWMNLSSGSPEPHKQQNVGASRSAAFSNGFGMRGFVDPQQDATRDAYRQAGNSISYGPHSAGDPGQFDKQTMARVINQRNSDSKSQTFPGDYNDQSY